VDGVVVLVDALADVPSGQLHHIRLLLVVVIYHHVFVLLIQVALIHARFPIQGLTGVLLRHLALLLEGLQVHNHELPVLQDVQLRRRNPLLEVTQLLIQVPLVGEVLGLGTQKVDPLQLVVVVSDLNVLSLLRVVGELYSALIGGGRCRAIPSDP